MKKLSIILLAVSLIAFSCNKEDETTPETASATMKYDGVTYTEFDTESLNMVNGMIAAIGTTGDGFSLMINGVGADGSTVQFTPEVTSVILDFGAAVGKEAFTAQSGTIKRTGNKVEIDVTGVTTSLDTKTVTATINLNKIIDL